MHLSSAEVVPEYPPPPLLDGAPPEGGRSNGPSERFRGVLMTVAAAIILGLLLLVAFHGKTPIAQKIAASPAADSPAIQTLRLKGVTEAVRMRAILAPVLSGQYVATLTITKLAPAGTKVKQGDILAEFDRQAQIRDSLDKQADYDKLVGQVAEAQSKEDAARAKDETEIKQAEDDLSKAQLEVQKVEIMSRIDAEKAQETLEEGQATLAQLRETFALKRKAAQAGIRILEIQRDRTQQIMLHARADADLMEIHAPLDGVVVLNTIWRQGQIGEVREGDQLRSGNPFMQVVDPSAMQVRVPVNQEDFMSLRVGQAARIHLDAYPELVFPGMLEEMAPIGRSGDFSSRLRTFTVVFSVTGQDPKMMPDLSAAVDVDLPGQDDARQSSAPQSNARQDNAGEARP
jgi:HlyD family secretion protein